MKKKLNLKNSLYIYIYIYIYFIFKVTKIIGSTKDVTEVSSLIFLVQLMQDMFLSNN